MTKLLNFCYMYPSSEEPIQVDSSKRTDRGGGGINYDFRNCVVKYFQISNNSNLWEMTTRPMPKNVRTRNRPQNIFRYICVSCERGTRCALSSHHSLLRAYDVELYVRLKHTHSFLLSENVGMNSAKFSSKRAGPARAKAQAQKDNSRKTTVSNTAWLNGAHEAILMHPEWLKVRRKKVFLCVTYHKTATELVGVLSSLILPYGVHAVDVLFRTKYVVLEAGRKTMYMNLWRKNKCTAQ